MFDSWFEANWVYGYCVTDTNGCVLNSRESDRLFESASIVKLLIMQLFLEKMTREARKLTDNFKVKKEHLSNGSGLVNWTEWKLVSIESLIYLTCVYSDCVTTNIMLDEIGGKKKINSYLGSLGSASLMTMDRIRFDDSIQGIESVAKTSASESVNLMSQLITSPKVDRVFQDVVIASLNEICEPWFNPYHLGKDWNINNLLFKTGSMIDTDLVGTTVLNLAGIYIKNGQKLNFAFFSQGPLRTKDVTYTGPTIQEALTDYISRKVMV